MRRLLLASIFAAALAVPGITLTMLSNPFGLFFVVASDAPRHLYVQIDGEGGATIQSAAIYEYDIGAGELFGHQIEASGPGAVRVRVWDGDTAPAADTTFPLPTVRVYVPLIR